MRQELELRAVKTCINPSVGLPSRSLPFPFPVVLCPAGRDPRPTRRPQISSRPTPLFAAFRACRGHPKALQLILFEQKREVLVRRLEGALDHEATAVAVHRHTLGVRVSG